MPKSSYSIFMYISCHQISGAKVYDSEGHLITRLTDVLIDPNNGHVLALQSTIRGANLISPHDIISWKRHYLTLGHHYEFHSPGDLVRVEKLLQTKHPSLLNKHVHTENGIFLGQVTDFSIHVDHFILASLTVQKKFLFWKRDTRLIHQTQIVEIKSNDIIVKDTLIKLPVRQNSPDKFALQKAPTLDQALCEPADHTSV